MYAGNGVISATRNNGNRGLRLTKNYKAGAAASNPSLLNREQVAVGNLKIHGYAIVGMMPCRPILSSM